MLKVIKKHHGLNGKEIKPPTTEKLTVEAQTVGAYAVSFANKHRAELFERLACAVLANGGTLERLVIMRGVEMIMQAECSVGIADGEIDAEGLCVGGSLALLRGRR